MPLRLMELLDGAEMALNNSVRLVASAKRECDAGDDVTASYLAEIAMEEAGKSWTVQQLCFQLLNDADARLDGRELEPEKWRPSWAEYAGARQAHGVL